MKLRTPKFGDIYFADLVADGSVQGGRRPVLIAQNDIGNLHSPVVEVIPLSSKLKARYMPTHPVIRASTTNGLSADSVVLAERVRVINKDRLLRWIGVLTHHELVNVGKARSVQSPFPVI